MKSLGELCTYSFFSKHKKYLMGVATLMIGVFHIIFFAPKAIHKIPVLYDIIGTFNVGVEIFLFLSGIGLYYSFSKNPKFIDYYIKRFLNVFLVFLPISFAFSYWYCFINGNYPFSHFILKGLSLTYWMNLSNENRQGWYVVYIMILYIIYPFINKAIKKLDKRNMCFPVTVITCGIITALCIVMNKYFPRQYYFIEIGLTRLPIFLLGCYFGKLSFENKKIKPDFWVAAVIGLFLRILYLKSEEHLLVYNRLSQCLFSVAVMCVTVLIAELVSIGFIYKAFELLGSMSLEFYLIHNYLRDVIKGFGFTRIRHYFYMLILTLILSYIISRIRLFVVKKYVQLKKKKKN